MPTSVARKRADEREPTGRATSRSIPAAQPRLASDPRRLPSVSRPSGAEEHLRWPGSPVVGRTERRRVRAGVSDRHEVAPLEWRQVVRAERVGRFADRTLDTSRRQVAAGAPRRGRRRAARASSRRGSDGALHREPAGSARSCRRRGRSGAPPGRGRGGPARPASPLGRPAPDRVRSRCGPGDGRRGRRPAMDPSSRANRSGVGCRFTGRTDREPATEIDGVERGDRSAPQRSERERLPYRVAPCVDRAELRPDVEMDAPWPKPAVRAAAGIDRAGDLGLGHAELRATGSDGETGQRLGGDVRVQPVEHVERWCTDPCPLRRPVPQPPPATRSRSTGAAAHRPRRAPRP